LRPPSVQLLAIHILPLLARAVNGTGPWRLVRGRRGGRNDAALAVQPKTGTREWGRRGIVTVDDMETAPLARTQVIPPGRRIMLLRKLLEVVTTDDPSSDARDAGTQQQRDAA
jgi:hypothetical protein